MMLHIPRVLDRGELDSMRSALAKAEWIDGRETVGEQGAQVQRNLQLAETSPLRKELGETVRVALARSAMFFAATLPLRILPARFNRYEGGGTYGFHVDSAVMTLPHSPGEQIPRLRSDVSCTLFLSEPDEYDGGELIIKDTYGEHDVKLPAGDLIVYPSSSVHRVAPVTRGARNAAFFWVQSMVRRPDDRQLLLQLDTTVQGLTRAGADRATILRLTDLYHNLLRRWSET